MHGELHVSASVLIAFAMVLARLTGVFVFIPMPFKDAGPTVSRVVLALGCTIALYPRWPKLEVASLTLTSALVLILTDAALGAGIGLVVSFLSEAFTVGAQSLALQAGYGYASVIDPTTEADSEVLAVVAQLLAGLFFVTTGVHRFLIKVFADSLEKHPPGTFSVTQNLAKQIIHTGSGIFSVGLRLALPIIGLLLMTEISLALLGRVNPQLHLGMHSFPIKMLLTLLALASILTVAPQLYARYADEVFRSIRYGFLR